jgi:hypothetical protein
MIGFVESAADEANTVAESIVFTSLIFFSINKMIYLLNQI